MWRDASKKEIAAQALRITAPDLKEMQIIDEIIPEPDGGAHLDHDGAAALVDETLQRHYNVLKGQSAQQLVASRYDKFRHMAHFFTE
jgi:acetyl-CoA carboxylase carboxyl transferase subunit alpha